MSQVEWAEAEMVKIGMDDGDRRVMQAIMRAFYDKWNSGGAVHAALPVLLRLMTGVPLSPLSGADDEWNDISQTAGRPMLQNKRCSTVFREPRPGGGNDDYDIGVGHGRVSIIFPYMPGQRSNIADPVVLVPGGPVGNGEPQPQATVDPAYTPVDRGFNGR